MKIKTQDLIGPPLDWAVGKSLGEDIVIETTQEQAERFRAVLLHDGEKPSEEAVEAVIANLKPILRIRGSHNIHLQRVPSYSTTTSGDTVIEIMEREKISALSWANGWKACYAFDTEEFGPTLRIAVCRCFVASKLGDEVDVPEELL